MDTDGPADDHHVARPGLIGRDADTFGHQAQSRGVHKEEVPAALFHHLGVARDQGHALFATGDGHGLGDALQISDRQTLFENETGAEIEGLRSTHGQIVDRAVNGQRTDITTREEDGTNDKGIGGES